jgi:DNA-binding CsgD family transcriptional regulator/ligand-binding sensor domain-containing protein
MEQRHLKYCLFYLAFLLPFFVKADNIKSIGVPYVQNYTKSAYRSGNQNWSVAKNKDGIMYFGNAQGLLSYDGKYWQQYKMPNRQIVRAVATDAEGIIYTGGFGDFGYWKVENRRLKYSSLINLIPKNFELSSEIWKIYVDGKRIIFQSFSNIYIYQDHKISVVKPSGSFLFLHQVNDRLILEVLGQGLSELKGDRLVPLNNTGTPLPGNVLSILPYKNGSLLIGTSKDGLFLYDGTSYTRFNSPANTFLQTYQLNNGAKVLGKYYAYGTILNGLIIIDDNGNIVQQINKASGLQNNTVLSLYADDNQNLWAGLDNGIDRIELSSALYFYFDKTGQIGTVYSSLIFNNTIYLGTNQGLFYSPWTQGNTTQFNTFNFKLVPNSQGQVWDLRIIDGQLLCGHNDGTFRVNGTNLEKLTNLSGGWTIRKLDDNHLIQGSYNGLLLFKKDNNGKWISEGRIKGFDGASRYVEKDSRGDIWISHAYKGLYKLTLSPDFKTVTSVKSYTEKNGLPSTYNINLFNFQNRIIYSSDSGFLIYDDISNRFTAYKELNNGLGSFAKSNRIIDAGNKKYWFINRGKMAFVNFSQPGKINVDSNSFSILDGKMVQYYENISKISDQIYLISIDDGFVIYNEIDEPNRKKIQLPDILIRKIEDITDTYATISEVGNASTDIEIPFSRNNISIAFALPYYRQTVIKFQYYLKGYSKQWSDWSTVSQKEFTNLSAGDYVFIVRAKINDEIVSKESEFTFTVLPPFYASKWALILYFILAAFLLYVFKRLYDRKLKKDQQAISDKLLAEKDAFLKKEAEATEKQIIKLQTEKLQTELAGKNRELANSAMSLVYKNELLQKLSQEILKLKDGSGKPLAEEQLRRIQKVIDEGMNDERDWNLFESSFNEAHESFFKKLKVNHPDLVPNDLKLCAYLRMNMSSKEMASLLNISLRGVEIRRYRLRKKLDVPRDKNLVEFLMEL